MTERRSPSAARTPLAPDELLRRSFSSSFRGFDPTEVRDFLVRIADDLRVSYAREQELELRIALLEEKLSQPPVIDEAMVMAHLGEETTRVLASAREAANEMRAKAEAELGDAIERAKEVHSHTHGEADTYAADVRAAAESDAEAMLIASQERAQELLTDARASGRAMLQQAQELRMVVLQDLQKRRRVAYSQVEQLLAGRDHLLETLESVRSDAGELGDRLKSAEHEARAAAQAARDSALAEPQQSVEEVIARLTAIELADLEDEIVAEYVEEDSAENAPSRSAVRIVRSKRRSLPTNPQREEQNGDVLSDSNNGNGKVAPPREATKPTIHVEVSEFGDVDEGVKILRPGSRPDDNGDEDSARGGEGVGDEQVIDLRDSAAMVDELMNESLDDEHDVDALFAQMREQRERAVAEAERILAEEVKRAPAEPEPSELDTAEEIPGEVDETAKKVAYTIRARNEAVEKFGTKLSKKLKKVMQNEQNEVLDAIRNQRGRPTVEALPSEDSQRRAYKAAVHESISDCVRAGIASLENGSEGEHVQVQVRTAEDNFLNDFLVPLRRKLQQAIAAAPEMYEEGERSVLEAVGVAYREARNQRAESIIIDTICSSYMRGVYCAANSDMSFTWNLGDEPTGCDDCTSNQAVGAVSVGTAFPSGHMFPLAHAGCRCLIVKK